VGASEFHFVSRWQALGTRDEAYAILADLPSLSSWWPAVFLDCDLVEDGGPDGIGLEVCVCTRAWFSQVQLWHQRITAATAARELVIDTIGDIEGRGRWILDQDGPRVVVVSEWRGRVRHALGARLGWILKPFLVSNYHWAMARGEEGLRLEIARRRTAALRTGERSANRPDAGSAWEDCATSRDPGSGRADPGRW
jgi:hypothetical protein